MNRKIYDIVSKVLSEGSGGMCSECGNYSMNEGMCSECGYMKESKEMCSECGKGNTVEGECSECGYNEGEFKEELKGNQKRIDLNKNNKIDADDFRRLRMRKKHKSETNEIEDTTRVHEFEVEESPEFNYAAMKARESGKKSFKLGGKTFPVEEDVYELNMNESTGERINLKESEIIEIIETIVTEEKKKKKTTKVNNTTKSAQSRSKKENDDYIDSVVKKMKDYLKGGSKGDFEMNPKHFPKGNGELAKMDKMGYNLSDTAHEYIDNFTGAGLENLDYDEIHPNEKWVEKNIMGSSETGNNPEWANAVETPINKNRNQIRQDNLLAKIKRMAYQKDDQPVKMDRTGSDTGDDNNKLTSMLKTSAKKSKKLKESKIENTEVLNEITQMKNLINYNKNTQ